ncbi:MAG: DUF2232 domain-containing protein [Coriobacteriia bacterium]
MARADANGDVARPSATGISVAIGLSFVGAALSLGLPFIGVPIAGGALAWLWYRKMPALAVAVSVLAGAATVIVDPVGPLYVVPWLLFAGPVTAVLLTKRSVAGVLVLVAVLNVAVWIGLLTGVAALQGTSAQAFMRSLSNEATKPAIEQAASTGENVEEVTEQIEMVGDTFARLWPAILTLAAALTALLSVGTVAAVAERAGVSVSPVPKLEKVDIGPGVVLGLIVAVALIAVDKFLGGWNDQLLGVVGDNLLLVVRWVLFVQGVAVFAGLYHKVGFTRLSRTLGYVVLGLTETLVPLVSLTGLVDMWLNVRKLPRDGRDSAGGTTRGLGEGPRF